MKIIEALKRTIEKKEKDLEILREEKTILKEALILVAYNCTDQRYVSIAKAALDRIKASNP